MAGEVLMTHQEGGWSYDYYCSCHPHLKCLTLLQQNKSLTPRIYKEVSERPMNCKLRSQVTRRHWLTFEVGPTSSCYIIYFTFDFATCICYLNWQDMKLTNFRSCASGLDARVCAAAAAAAVSWVAALHRSYVGQARVP